MNFQSSLLGEFEPRQKPKHRAKTRLPWTIINSESQCPAAPGSLLITSTRSTLFIVTQTVFSQDGKNPNEPLLTVSWKSAKLFQKLSIGLSHHYRSSSFITFEDTTNTMQKTWGFLDCFSSFSHSIYIYWILEQGLDEIFFLSGIKLKKLYITENGHNVLGFWAVF